jgi:hypothetical protein
MNIDVSRRIDKTQAGWSDSTEAILRPYLTAVNNAMIYLTDYMLQCLRGLSLFHSQVNPTFLLLFAELVI